MDILFGDVLTVSTYDVLAVWIGAGVVLASLALHVARSDRNLGA